nr:S8 family peptidase [Solirubrobacter soli]
MVSRLTLALVASTVAVAATPSVAGAQEIPGQYIVVLKDQTSAPAADKAKTRVRDRGGKVQREYSRVLKGFSAKLGKDALAEVKSDPAVAYVEPDRVITLDATQNNATWGLDRIDQRNLPLSTTYSYDTTAPDVTAYIIDTGIRFSHQQFGGRAVSGYDAVDGGSADDCNGHGTHVAGTVGGSTYGVAKQVKLVGVRVLNCSGSGTTSGVVAGIDWVTGNHQAGAPAVANMSLGGGVSTTLDNAVVRAINDGVTFAVAAGNDNANACNSSPSRVAAALTVGSTTSTDARSSFSLRHLRRRLRARLEHHLVLVLERHGHQHDQRHVDGDTARDRGGRALPGGQPGGESRDGRGGDHGQRDAERRRQPGQRLAEPPVVHEPVRRADADPHADAHGHADHDADAHVRRDVHRHAERHRRLALQPDLPDDDHRHPARLPPRSGRR